MAILAEQPRHGYDIVQQLTGLTMFRGHAPDATGVYRLLKAMQRDELVASSWETADGGPAKRRYTLTPQGKDCLARWIRTLEQYQDSISDLLARLKAASGRKRARSR
ncbi:MAG: helix-turn-helix transcriptional regulator [Tepidisphaeraceae bacterium]|jgi:DNA-binding PadR family transcriptional regulator